LGYNISGGTFARGGKKVPTEDKERGNHRKLGWTQYLKGYGILSPGTNYQHLCEDSLKGGEGGGVLKVLLVLKTCKGG